MENEKAIFDLVKALFGVVKSQLSQIENHQSQIESLHRLMFGCIQMQSRIVEAVTGTEAESPSRFDMKDVERMRAEIRELERMFGANGPATDAGDAPCKE